MRRAAELSAVEAEDAGLCGLEPGLDVASRQDVLLDAKVRNRERMDDVLRRHDEPNRLVHRNVQAVDLAHSVGMLKLPHPLFRDDVDFRPRTRRKELRDLVRPRPPEKEKESEHGRGRPADFELMLHEWRQRAARRLRTAPVAKGEKDDQEENESDD